MLSHLWQHNQNLACDMLFLIPEEETITTIIQLHLKYFNLHLHKNYEHFFQYKIYKRESTRAQD